MVRVDGSGLRKLTRGRWATWSPNGRRIAFLRRGDLFTIRVDGTRVRRLTNLRRGDFAGDVVGASSLDWQPLP
jgi:hypothetical protein